MEIWHLFSTGNRKYFVSEKGKEKMGVKFSAHDLIEATASEDYSGLKTKYLLSEEDISILRTALKKGRWTVSAKVILN